jgi:hypothetical protein
MLNDERVEQFVEDVGEILVGAIPAELNHSEFRYTFDVVNQKEINAFALPGGPMFMHRGMIEAAKTEGEVAGVIAHEISHVALRHGTAQATKGQKFQIGAIAGQILGAIVGGTAGSVISQGSQFGLGAYFLKYGREYERQADLLGAQIMARAGYEPREMANMFKTIEAKGGGGGPEWLSDHPNPGNRYDAIIKEAATLRVDKRANTGQFQSVQARLHELSPALTAEQIAKGRARTGNGGTGGTRSRTLDVASPSAEFQTYKAGDSLRVSVPSNWRPYDGNNTVTYAPEGAYFEADGGTAFTHGMEVGVTQGSGDLSRDTEQLLRGFVRSNADLRAAGKTRREKVGGLNGLTTPLSNVSGVTGQREYVSLSTAQLPDGNVLYLIGVAPQSEAGRYENVFRRVRQNVQIASR